MNSTDTAMARVMSVAEAHRDEGTDKLIGHSELWTESCLQQRPIEMQEQTS